MHARSQVTVRAQRVNQCSLREKLSCPFPLAFPRVDKRGGVRKQGVRATVLATTQGDIAHAHNIIKLPAPLIIFRLSRESRLWCVAAKKARVSRCSLYDRGPSVPVAGIC